MTQKATRSTGNDRRLLRRFLRGELTAHEVSELEGRLDAEPELAAQLGKIARSQQESIGEVEISDETQRVTVGLSRSSHPKPHANPNTHDTDGLTLGPMIGQGGMAKVHLGRQQSVGREVAIKTVRSTGAEADVLLEEAYITGQLEHPNIVPIHDIGVSVEGYPRVVLKHIEGESWGTLIRDEDAMRDWYGSIPPLDWHLGVFLQVCQALRFAHSRGIIHRDVKPSNVMIGAFDDIYLLDWGLALAIDEDDQLPSIATARGVAGTPAYMAPEQLERVPSKVGPHTDVYLLGATLFEVVTGAPPQAGATLGEIRAAIVNREELALPKSCPAELAAIIRRALAPEIEARFQTVAELRQAVESFIQHQSSHALADAGDARAKKLRRAHAQRDHELADRVFAEGAFSYRMALEEWSDNPRAKGGLVTIVIEQVDALLDRKAPLAAQRVIALLDRPPADLRRRLDDALAQRANEQEHFARLARDDDRRVGHRTRRVLLVFLGALWVGGWATLGWAPPDTLLPVALATMAYLAAAVLLVLRRRKEMLTVRVNRNIIWLVFIVLVTQLVLTLGTRWSGTPTSEVFVVLLLLWASVTACGALTVDLRILPAALTLFAAHVLCAVSPEQLSWVMGTAAAALIANMLYINRAIAREAASDPALSTLDPRR